MSLLKRLEAEKTEIKVVTDAKVSQKDPYQDTIHTIHREVIKEMDTEFLKLQGEEGQENAERIRQEIRKIAETVLDKETAVILRGERDKIITRVIDEVLGYGPISPLLNDEDVSEVMVNGPSQVYVERKGKIEMVPVVFRDDDHVLNVIEKIISPLGRRVDESMPMVDARLPDGSRVNAIIPPLALNGPTITIRKFAADLLGIDDLVRFGSLSPAMARFLEAAVKGRMNIVVSGGTGAGKTSTLNVRSSFIPTGERIITIEDAAELKLDQEHVVSLETRPPNIEGRGAIAIRDLVRNSLRMRPDRIVVGEVRGGEALDMLQAMNTGHDGSLTTGHSNSPRDMISRMETMVLMAGMDLPIRAIREQISSALDLIVHQSRLKDGSRKITHITEVLGMEGEVVVLQDIFIFEQTGVDSKGNILGRHRATGIRPKCLDQLITSGIVLPAGIFEP